MAGAGPGGGLAAAPATEDEEALAQWADEILLGCEAEHAHAAEAAPVVHPPRSAHAALQADSWHGHGIDLDELWGRNNAAGGAPVGFDADAGFEPPGGWAPPSAAAAGLPPAQILGSQLLPADHRPGGRGPQPGWLDTDLFGDALGPMQPHALPRATVKAKRSARPCPRATAKAAAPPQRQPPGAPPANSARAANRIRAGAASGGVRKLVQAPTAGEVPKTSGKRAQTTAAGVGEKVLEKKVRVRKLRARARAARGVPMPEAVAAAHQQEKIDTIEPPAQSRKMAGAEPAPPQEAAPATAPETVDVVRTTVAQRTLEQERVVSTLLTMVNRLDTQMLSNIQLSLSRLASSYAARVWIAGGTAAAGPEPRARALTTNKALDGSTGGGLVVGQPVVPGGIEGVARMVDDSVTKLLFHHYRDGPADGAAAAS